MTDDNLPALNALAIEINAEHMGGWYLWRIRKPGQRVHIENLETERAYCQGGDGWPAGGRGQLGLALSCLFLRPGRARGMAGERCPHWLA